MIPANDHGPQNLLDEWRNGLCDQLLAAVKPRPKPASPPTPAPLGRYLNVAQAAVYLGRSEKSIRRLVERREIPHLRVRRKLSFDREALDRWMARHKR